MLRDETVFERNASAVLVSNHGGRQLDQARWCHDLPDRMITQPLTMIGMVSAMTTVRPHSAGAEPRGLVAMAAIRRDSPSPRVNHQVVVRKA